MSVKLLSSIAYEHLLQVLECLFTLTFLNSWKSITYCATDNTVFIVAILVWHMFINTLGDLAYNLNAELHTDLQVYGKANFRVYTQVLSIYTNKNINVLNQSSKVCH